MGKPAEPSQVLGGRETETYRVNSAYSHQSNTSPFRTILGALCSLAILFFIIILLINFISFFPAVAITAPELINQHEIELKTELPIIIDNESPIITSLQDTSITTAPGQQIELNYLIQDFSLKEAYLELDFDNSRRVPIIFNNEAGQYKALFQAPVQGGTYTVKAFAVDFAGNIGETEFNILVQTSSKPVLEISPQKNYQFLNSRDIFTFTTDPSNIQQVSYTIDNQDSILISNAENNIPLAGLNNGPHELRLNLQTNDGLYNDFQFSFQIDNTPPQVSKLDLKPLTIHRNNTFKNKLNETTYYQGELVDLSLYIDESYLDHTVVFIKDKDSTKVKTEQFMVLFNDDESENDNNDNNNNNNNNDSTSYLCRGILLMPNDPGKYILEIQAVDFAGNIESITRPFQVASLRFDYEPVPIIKIDLPEDPRPSLPIINPEHSFSISTEIGNIDNIQLIIGNRTAPDEVIEVLEIDETGKVILTNIQVSDGVLEIESKVEFRNWDKLFITLPIPPYLFVLPFLISGWYLFAFFIFIAIAIILSNLKLIKSSISNAIDQIKSSFENLNGPIKNSNNTIIELAQIFLAVYSFSVLYNLILTFGQVTTRTPDFSSLSIWTFIYNLTSAAVYEEIISRILLIGVPLYIIHHVTKRVKTPKYRYLLGGDFDLNKVTIILIIFSSITFGLAHAPGWDYWKVLPTVVSGIALGYLFVVKGVYASILLHFSVNYLFIPLRLANYPIELNLFYTLLIYFWLIIGIYYIVHYFKKIIQFTTKKPIKSIT